MTRAAGRTGPHLKTSLAYVDAILDYLARHEISMYRMSSDLAPYATHPTMPQFHGMVAESDRELGLVGAKARRLGIRLSFHPSQYVLLNSPDPELTRKSIEDLASQADMLDRMEQGPEAVVVTHVGGVYGDLEGSRSRWARTWEGLPEPVRRRLVLEHDDLRFSAADVLWIHERTGVRLIFDYQHFWCHNPERLDMIETLGAILRTWPADVRPKIHFSSPRTEFRAVERLDRSTKKRRTHRSAAALDGACGFHQSLRVRKVHARFGRPRFRRDAGEQGQGPQPPQAAPGPASLRARRRRPFWARILR